MTRHRTRATTALLAALAFAGCSAQPEPAPVTAVIQTPAPPPMTSVPDDPTGPAPDPAAGTRTPPKNQISIDPEQTGRTAAAAAAAITFMNAYARPHLTAAAWQAGVAPLLTDSARAAARSSDPKSITARKVTSAGMVLPGAEKDARTVTVPTDGGTYTLFLRWDPAGARWLVQAYRPPEIHYDE